MNQAVKVGIFLTLCLVLLGYLILRVEDIELFAKGGERVDAVFPSVAGLDDKAAVRIAGVRVGRVDGVRLEETHARVTLRLDQPVRLTQGTTAAITSLSLLGEKYVELKLGPADAPLLPAGEVLQGTTPITFDQAMEKLNGIGDSIQEITGSISGKGSETSISRLIANLEAVSADIRELVAANKSQVSATVANFERFSGTLADELPKLTKNLEHVLEQVDSVLAENRDNLKGSMSNIREVTGKLQTSVDNLNEISGKIARGEGTIGKLVQSDEAHKQLVGALDSIQTGVKSLTDTLDRAKKLQLHLGLEGAYLNKATDSRAAISVELDPQSSRFYRIGLVSDPYGLERSKTDVRTVTGPDGIPLTTTTKTVTTEKTNTLDAQLGFRFGDAQLRAGLFESKAGAGIDYGLLDHKLWLSFEAFNFSREDNLNPHLRLDGRYWLSPNIYLLGGVDDLLVRERRSAIVGAGVRWSDDDLKYLLGSIPRF